jgi:hypothetical protein
MRVGVAFIKRPDRTVPLKVSVQWYCEHMAPKIATFSVAPDPCATPAICARGMPLDAVCPGKPDA